MSNRNPHYADFEGKNDSGTTHESSPFGTSGEIDNSSAKAKETMHDGLNKAESAAGEARSQFEEGKGKAKEAAGMARDRADEGMDKAGDTLDKAANVLRQRGEEQSGTMGAAAGTAADAMESAGAFLHDANTGEMMDQMEAYIRANPTQSLLIAAGVGFVLAKAFK